MKQFNICKACNRPLPNRTYRYTKTCKICKIEFNTNYINQSLCSTKCKSINQSMKSQNWRDTHPGYMEKYQRISRKPVYRDKEGKVIENEKL